MDENEKLLAYEKLIDMNYETAVLYLLEKNGPATKDYFKERSYQRFLNDEIKYLHKGNASRTKEGLYCHHIDENKYINVTNLGYIKIQRIPFSVQRKERLIYCDLVEHTIIHLLIMIEYGGNFGIGGFYNFLLPNIYDWYLNKIDVPEETKWSYPCYKRAFLSVDGVEILINDLKQKLEDNNLYKKELFQNTSMSYLKNGGPDII